MLEDHDYFDKCLQIYKMTEEQFFFNAVKLIEIYG